MNKDFYFEKLRKLMVEKMASEDFTLEKMSEICNISHRQLCNILYGNSSDIYLSTFSKICDNLHISYYEIFCLEKDIENERKVFENILSEYYLTDGKFRYYLRNK